MALDNTLKNHISEIAKSENPFSKDELKSVANAISKLNNFIEEKISLSDDEIKVNLKVLLKNDIDMNFKEQKGKKIIRGRKGEDTIVDKPFFENIEKLSYPPKGLSFNTGRCNLKDESVFYACININNEEECKRVAYSEINITEGENIYLLMSETTDTLILKYLGIFSHLYRNAKPYFMSEKMWDNMKLVYKHIVTEFNDDLFRARYLCDTFIADIMRRKESGNLYKVTSVLTHMYWLSGVIDGILYTSVKVEGEPIVVLNTNTVDNKIEHKKTELYKIVKDYGYAVYETNILFSGAIHSGKIIWK